MKTDKLQRLEDVEDLKILDKGDIIDVETFGNMAYFGNKENKMVFVGRDGTRCLVNLVINPNSNHIIEKGRIMFKQATYIAISYDNHTKNQYEMQNQFLEELEL